MDGMLKSVFSVVVMSVGRLVVILQAGTALDVDFLCE